MVDTKTKDVARKECKKSFLNTSKLAKRTLEIETGEVNPEFWKNMNAFNASDKIRQRKLQDAAKAKSNNETNVRFNIENRSKKIQIRIMLSNV